MDDATYLERLARNGRDVTPSVSPVGAAVRCIAGFAAVGFVMVAVPSVWLWGVAAIFGVASSEGL